MSTQLVQGGVARRQAHAGPLAPPANAQAPAHRARQGGSECRVYGLESRV
jgi:hypothetical protein